jgi:hypothetical protein
MGSASAASSISARVGYRTHASGPIERWVDLAVEGGGASSQGACTILLSAALDATTGTESSTVLRACAPQPLPALSIGRFGYVLWERLHQAGRDLLSPSFNEAESELADQIAAGKIIAHETRARWFLSDEACANEKKRESRPQLRRYLLEHANKGSGGYEAWRIPDSANLACQPLPSQKPDLIQKY